MYDEIMVNKNVDIAYLPKSEKFEAYKFESYELKV